MFDLLISGGEVVDGTGRPRFRADIGIARKRIAAIGNLAGAATRRTIDGAGLVVCPGFIDTHVHTDAALLNDPQHASGIRMGVTTEVLGQDGLSYACLGRDNYALYGRYMSGLCGVPPPGLDMSTVAAFRSHYHRKCAVNTVTLVPHSAVRLETVGFRDVPLRGQALDKALALVRAGMEDGAAGFSIGLGFFPSAWADTRELVELARAVAGADRVFVGQHRFFHLERAHRGGGAAEFLEIGRRSGAKVHLAHYFPHAFPSGTEASKEGVEGAIREFMHEIDAAKREGVDITLDAYPYPAGSTMPVCRLPGWAAEGGPDAIVRRLRSKPQRARIAAFLDERHGDGLGSHVFTYVGSAKNRWMEGTAWRDVARQTGESVADMICRVMAEEDLNCGLLIAPAPSVRVWRQIEAGVMALYDRPDYTVGSDSIPVGGMPHPRAFGTFPRILGRLRRRHGASLEGLVHHMTELPARRFGLKGRGVLAKGAFADVVAFDPEEINDTATYEDPCSFPLGIPYVAVNGQVAVDGGHCTGVLAGEAIP